MTNTLVVGVDGSADSTRALRWAVTEARRRDWQVTAITAWLPRPVVPSSIPMAITQPTDPREEDSYRVQLDQAVTEATKDDPYPVRAQLRRGSAADVLTQEAGPDDLLVVGSHGHGRVLTTVLGSVSAACVRKARCPVVVIPTRLPST